MKKLVLATAVVTCFATPMTFAQSMPPLYAELNYAWPKVESTGPSATPQVAGGRIGLQLNENFAAELYLATSAREDTVNGVDLKIKNAAGLYLKGMAPLGERAKLVGRVGYLRAKLESSGPGGSLSNTDNSFSYGIGLQYDFTPQVYGIVDYMSFYDRRGLTVRGPMVGVGLKF